jgi:hypothetical protein
MIIFTIGEFIKPILHLSYKEWVMIMGIILLQQHSVKLLS